MQEIQETCVQSLGQEDLLEEEMATHSVLLPEKFHGQRSLAATVHGVTKNQTKPSDSAHVHVLVTVTWGKG